MGCEATWNPTGNGGQASVQAPHPVFIKTWGKTGLKAYIPYIYIFKVLNQINKQLNVFCPPTLGPS